MESVYLISMRIVWGWWMVVYNRQAKGAQQILAIQGYVDEGSLFSSLMLC